MKAVPVIDKDFQLVIPTHGRPNKQTTLMRLSQVLREKTLVITSLEEEARDIRKNYKNIGYGGVFSLESFGALESHGQRIHTKRQWILENVKSKNILQFDDDLYFFQRCSPKFRSYDSGQWKLTEEGKRLGKKLLYTATEDRITKSINRFAEVFMDKGYVHGGFGSRMGNDKEELEIDFTGGRLMHSIAHNRKKLIELGLRFDEVNYREDFNLTLHLMRRGYKGLRVFNFAVSPNGYQEPGGCSTYRTQKASDRSAMHLALIHPGFVRLVEKQYKDHPRLEVHIMWVKALGSKATKLIESGGRKVAAEVAGEGMFRVLCYEGLPPLWAYSDGEHWTVPTFNKPNLKTNETRLRALPFPVKKVK